MQNSVAAVFASPQTLGNICLVCILKRVASNCVFADGIDLDLVTSDAYFGAAFVESRGVELLSHLVVTDHTALQHASLAALVELCVSFHSSVRFAAIDRLITVGAHVRILSALVASMSTVAANEVVLEAAATVLWMMAEAVLQRCTASSFSVPSVVDVAVLDALTASVDILWRALKVGCLPAIGLLSVVGAVSPLVVLSQPGAVRVLQELCGSEPGSAATSLHAFISLLIARLLCSKDSAVCSRVTASTIPARLVLLFIDVARSLNGSFESAASAGLLVHTCDYLLVALVEFASNATADFRTRVIENGGVAALCGLLFNCGAASAHNDDDAAGAGAGAGASLRASVARQLCTSTSSIVGALTCLSVCASSPAGVAALIKQPLGSRSVCMHYVSASRHHFAVTR